MAALSHAGALTVSNCIKLELQQLWSNPISTNAVVCGVLLLKNYRFCGRYDKHGKAAVLEGSPMDAATVFGMAFGSDVFEVCRPDPCCLSVCRVAAHEAACPSIVRRPGAAASRLAAGSLPQTSAPQVRECAWRPAWCGVISTQPDHPGPSPLAAYPANVKPASTASAGLRGAAGAGQPGVHGL